MRRIYNPVIYVLKYLYARPLYLYLRITTYIYRHYPKTILRKSDRRNGYRKLLVPLDKDSELVALSQGTMPPPNTPKRAIQRGRSNLRQRPAAFNSRDEESLLLKINLSRLRAASNVVG